jgi:hypothetical protein
MSAFENFVQLELPKRPYLDTDSAQETIMVRRGAGPRQLVGVSLTDGQVLGQVGGVVQGVSIGDGATFRKYVEEVTVAATTWTIAHNLDSENVIVQVMDADGYVILPNEIQVVNADTVTVTFHSLQTGTARLIFLD